MLWKDVGKLFRISIITKYWRTVSPSSWLWPPSLAAVCEWLETKSSDVRDPETVLDIPPASSQNQDEDARKDWICLCQSKTTASCEHYRDKMMLISQMEEEIKNSPRIALIYFLTTAFFLVFIFSRSLIRKSKLDNIKQEIRKWKNFHRRSVSFPASAEYYCRGLNTRLKCVFQCLFVIFLSHKMFYDKLKMWHPEA